VDESSSIALGQLYVFLSEGTLVVASPNGKPSLGTWSSEEGALTMVEEGIPYKCDILGLSKTEFRIRSNNPGDPVEIRFEPAGGSRRRRSMRNENRSEVKPERTMSRESCRTTACG